MSPHSFFKTSSDGLLIFGFAAIACCSFTGCAPQSPGSTNVNDNTSASNNNSSGTNDNSSPSNSNQAGGAGNNNSSGNSGNLPFSGVTGNETYNEGTDSSQPNGAYRRGSEHFTSNFTLMPSSVTMSQVLIGDALVDEYFGDLTGQAQLSYLQFDTDNDPELECPMSMLSGEVEWNATLSGSYTFIPAVGTLNILAFADPVSSPDYIVTYVVPDCPEQYSMQNSQYAWPGPAQGNPAAAEILLQDGHFESRIENPFGNDLGEQDFYEIVVDLNP